MLISANTQTAQVRSNFLGWGCTVDFLVYSVLPKTGCSHGTEDMEFIERCKFRLPWQFWYMNNWFDFKWRQDYYSIFFHLKILTLYSENPTYFSVSQASVKLNVSELLWCLKEAVHQMVSSPSGQVSQIVDILCVPGGAVVLAQRTASGKTIWCHGPSSTIHKSTPHEAS